MLTMIRAIVVMMVLLVIAVGIFFILAKSFTYTEMIVYQVDDGTRDSIYFHDMFTQVSYNSTLPIHTDVMIRNSVYSPVASVLQWDEPAWSPDGEMIAFVSQRDGNHNLYLLDLNTNSFFQLTNSSWTDLAPVWSPDGRMLAFETIRNGYRGISILEFETGNISDIARLGDIAADYFFAMQSPIWSPDSTRIAFQARYDLYWDIYIFDLRRQGLVNITNSAAIDETYPEWRTQP